MPLLLLVPPPPEMCARASALAEEVTSDRLGQGIEVFSARSQSHGARKWTPADVREPAPHRLYRATASECFLLDERDQRIAVVVGE